LGQIIVQYTYVKLISIGGGPAGRSFAFPMKKTDLAHEVLVVERNRAEDTVEEITRSFAHEVSMNALCPTAMIFAPSRAGGLSHNEREHSTPEDLAASTNVLLHAVLATAGGGQAGRGAPGASPDRLYP
jgi:acetylornithine deacetylase/succinyl-diaminopimelate desuccinylase-like protein